MFGNLLHTHLQGNIIMLLLLPFDVIIYNYYNAHLYYYYYYYCTLQVMDLLFISIDKTINVMCWKN